MTRSSVKPRRRTLLSTGLAALLGAFGVTSCEAVLGLGNETNLPEDGSASSSGSGSNSGSGNSSGSSGGSGSSSGTHAGSSSGSGGGTGPGSGSSSGGGALFDSSSSSGGTSGSSGGSSGGGGFVGCDPVAGTYSVTYTPQSGNSQDCPQPLSPVTLDGGAPSLGGCPGTCTGNTYTEGCSAEYTGGYMVTTDITLDVSSTSMTGTADFFTLAHDGGTMTCDYDVTATKQ
jgi:hypothetical protein